MSSFSFIPSSRAFERSRLIFSSVARSRGNTSFCSSQRISSRRRLNFAAILRAPGWGARQGEPCDKTREGDGRVYFEPLRNFIVADFGFELRGVCLNMKCEINVPRRGQVFAESRKVEINRNRVNFCGKLTGFFRYCKDQCGLFKNTEV